MPLLTRLLTMPRHRPFLLSGLLIAGLYIGGCSTRASAT
jgi:hypothetical protein